MNAPRRLLGISVGKDASQIAQMSNASSGLLFFFSQIELGHRIAVAVLIDRSEDNRAHNDNVLLCRASARRVWQATAVQATAAVGGSKKIGGRVAPRKSIAQWDRAIVGPSSATH
ncbi:MAG TPA: hypothetical protein VNQ50_00260 [Xanthobacteraceae bacterium]|jgi:hypothetical protein|nr:hypothetical protein [Xanthobacteraceae bacterium]